MLSNGFLVYKTNKQIEGFKFIHRESVLPELEFQFLLSWLSDSILLLEYLLNDYSYWLWLFSSPESCRKVNKLFAKTFLYTRNLDRTAMKTLCVLWAMRTVCSLRSLPCLFRSNNQPPSVMCAMTIRTHPAYLYNHAEFYVKQKSSCFWLFCPRCTWSIF